MLPHPFQPHPLFVMDNEHCRMLVPTAGHARGTCCYRLVGPSLCASFQCGWSTWPLVLLGFPDVIYLAGITCFNRSASLSQDEQFRVFAPMQFALPSLLCSNNPWRAVTRSRPVSTVSKHLQVFNSRLPPARILVGKATGAVFCACDSQRLQQQLYLFWTTWRSTVW